MENSKRGLLIVISGPAGVGKGTICKSYLKKYSDTFFSVSTTTRNPRPGETDGVEYNFTTKENFESMIKDGDLLEHVEVFGNYYGTSKTWVENMIKQGNDVILEIEIVGANKVKQIYSEALLLFVMPPSEKELEKRIRGRQTEEEQEILQRLERSEEEINMMFKYDYFIVNDDVENAANQVRNIILAEKNSVKRYGKAQIEEYFAGIGEKDV